MPRPKAVTPTYRLHKQSGQAYAYIDGKQHLLGPHGKPESRAKYDRLLAEYFSNGRRMPVAASDTPTATSSSPTVSVLLEAFWNHASAYYSKPMLEANGEPLRSLDGAIVRIPTEQIAHFKQIVIALRWFYGEMRTADIGCQELEALREALMRPGEWRTAAGKIVRHEPWCRTHINRQMVRVRHIFGWGVTKKLVPASVHEEMKRLPGLRRGKSDARETKKVKPVDRTRALAIIPHLPKAAGVMVEVQILTGMRSTELCIMRPCDIDRTVTPWIYRPMFHKTQEHDIVREIALGPKARVLIEPYLKRDPQSFLFSPAEAEIDRLAELHKTRKTKVQPSQVLRGLQSKRRKRRRPPTHRYDRTSYYNAIRRACTLAFGMPVEFKPREKDTPEQKRDKQQKRSKWHKENSWFPHMARHRAGTDVRQSGGGMEGAQVVLGHANRSTTAIYAEADVEKAHRVIEQIG